MLSSRAAVWWVTWWVGCALPVGASTVGEVWLANSGAEAAQESFRRGLALLHNFEYRDAAAAFHEAQEIDPDFALAYWGEAMTHHHPIWMQTDREAAVAVLERLGPTRETRRAKAGTPREKAWLETVEVLYGEGTRRGLDRAWSEALGRMHRADPTDPEAAAFYALSILGTADEGRDFATYMKAAAVVEEAYLEHPRHPGVLHYLIHSYDDAIHAPLGLRAARSYAKVAPDAAHAQHMTSHIFVAMGMWSEVVDANETAAAVANRNRERRGRPATSCGHYHEWLVYGYLQQGRKQAARERVRACHEEATSSGDASAFSSLLQVRLSFVVGTEDWEGDVAAWKIDPAQRRLPERLNLAYTDGLVAAGRRRWEQLDEALERLRAARRELDGHVEANPASYAPMFASRATILVRQIEALGVAGRGNQRAAVALLSQAAEEEAALALTFGPPFVEQPTHELLGELLLELDRPAEALAAFETALARTPGRTAALRGLARSAEAVGQSTKAADARERLRSIEARAVAGP